MLIRNNGENSQKETLFESRKRWYLPHLRIDQKSMEYQIAFRMT